MSLRVLTALSGALVAVFLAQLGAPHARSTVDRAPLSQLMRRPGPVPDYAPMAAVWTHPQLMTIGAALPGALDEILHDRHQVDDYNPPKAEGDYVEGQVEDEQDGTLVWLRDYQPIYVRDKQGHLKALRYLAENPNRAAYLPIGLPLSEPFYSDKLVDPNQAARVEALPLLHENGNLVVAGRFVFLTDLIIEDNTEDHAEAHLEEAGFHPMSRPQIIETLARALERRPQDIIILPRMPGELTGHVDLFLMALDDSTVVVPEIHPKAIEHAGLLVDADLAHAVRRFLDAQANRMHRLGLRVIRLPMVPPLLLPPVDDEPDWDFVFYSPANGLLLRNENDAVAVLPGADLSEVAPLMAPLQRRYEAEWKKALASAGWKVRIVDATRLGRFLGLFRCVSAVVPAE